MRKLPQQLLLRVSQQPELRRPGRHGTSGPSRNDPSHHDVDKKSVRLGRGKRDHGSLRFKLATVASADESRRQPGEASESMGSATRPGPALKVTAKTDDSDG